MEELRSTAILDREIQDDAKRKAEKIAKSSEIECRKILEDVDSRISLLRGQKEKEYALTLKAYRKDIESSIPLEKQRRLVTFIDTAVQAALDSWFVSIGEEKRLLLLENLLKKYIPLLSGHTVQVWFSHYSPEKIGNMTERILGKQNIALVTELSDLQAKEKGCVDGLHIQTTKKDILCRATLEEIRQDLLSTKRQELAEALMCGRLPE